MVITSRRCKVGSTRSALTNSYGICQGRICLMLLIDSRTFRSVRYYSIKLIKQLLTFFSLNFLVICLRTFHLSELETRLALFITTFTSIAVLLFLKPVRLSWKPLRSTVFFNTLLFMRFLQVLRQFFVYQAYRTIFGQLLWLTLGFLGDRENVFSRHLEQDLEIIEVASIIDLITPGGRSWSLSFFLDVTCCQYLVSCEFFPVFSFFFFFSNTLFYLHQKLLFLFIFFFF